MTGTQSQERRAAPPGVRIFGVETEYGFALIGRGGGRIDPSGSVDALMGEVRKLVPYLHCSGERDVFTANGSRVYIDVGLHPEVASPECTTPDEAVAFTRAGDRLLARAARAVARAWPGGEVETVLWKANVDHRTGATWASHESYLHEAPQALFAEQLMSHLVTRIVYTGAGGFDNRCRRLRFVVSPRAFHLECPVSASSTERRGIFNTRDEPLARAPYRRLHVLAGESLWSEAADCLRVGTTALLVAQVDAGRLPQTGLDLDSPMEALGTIAADLECTATVALCSGRRLRAVAIQRRLLESVEADLGANHLPPWAASVCARWRAVLDRLEASPRSLAGVLDWPTKLAILERQARIQGLESNLTSEDTAAHETRSSARAAPLLETDLRFTRLDADGIFTVLDRDGALAHQVVSDAAVERALREPPASGRARLRGAWVTRLANERGALRCGWEAIVDRGRERRLRLDNPFQSGGEVWEPLAMLGAHRTPDPDAPVDPAVEAVEAALRTGTPRAALRLMRARLDRADPLSSDLCRYYVAVLGRLVPDVPVPVIRRGTATAGPVLAALLECTAAHGGAHLEHRVGTLLYRFHEGRGRHDRARAVIGRMLARARDRGDRADVAVLTNNLGYEHLLEGDWDAAEPLFERAIALIAEAGRNDEALSMRANLTECRFGRLDPGRWHTLVPMLGAVNRELVARRDWRARKTLRLLARLAHARGRPAAARRWARRALDASRGVPTQLREHDRACFEALNA